MSLGVNLERVGAFYGVRGLKETGEAIVYGVVWRLGDELSSAGADERAQAFERFFRGHELKALRIAELGVLDRDLALDCVQEAMVQLARRYYRRPEAEWRPLFYRILHNQVRDRQRRRGREQRLFGSRVDVHEYPLPAGPSADPEALHVGEQSRLLLEAALARLPLRQQQAFVLRAWEGMDTQATAFAMGISAGSVKTHFHRAQVALRQALQEGIGA